MKHHVRRHSNGKCFATGHSREYCKNLPGHLSGLPIDSPVVNANHQVSGQRLRHPIFEERRSQCSADNVWHETYFCHDINLPWRYHRTTEWPLINYNAFTVSMQKDVPVTTGTSQSRVCDGETGDKFRGTNGCGVENNRIIGISYSRGTRPCPSSLSRPTQAKSDRSSATAGMRRVGRDDEDCRGNAGVIPHDPAPP